MDSNKEIEYLESLKAELKDKPESDVKTKTIQAIDKKIEVLKNKKIITK
jgi:hypothetical protein